ncbi:uncharacterized protein [Palaemon carinicauda]|uniref:uncharacterized protein n=1 Tax=Palaemon carinicauda TaxID=392227 RepID=UPI0035B5D5D0
MPYPTSVNVNSSRKHSGTRSDPSRVDINPVVTVQSQPSSSTRQQAAAVSSQNTLSDIGLIIGADYYNAFVYCQDKYEDVSLISSTTSAVIFGHIPKWACNVASDEANVRSVIGTQSIVCSRISAPINPLDDEDISGLWSLDAIGISEDARSFNDQATIKHFSETIVKVGNKNTVDLPFRNNARPPTGYRKSLGQLYSLRKTLQSKPELFDQYQSVLDEYFKLGFSEEIEVEDDSFHPIDGFNHYLPRHPVFEGICYDSN